MVWRDDLGTITVDGKTLIGCSFRGAVFYVEESELTGGRRGPDHAAPNVDGTYPEDLGRRGRRVSLTGYVLGENYRRRKSDLLKALEESGAGQLADAYNGTSECVCRDYSVRETAREGGIARFTMLFVQSGDPALSISPDAIGQLNAATAAAFTQVGAEYVATANETLGTAADRPPWSLESITESITDVSAQIKDARQAIVAGPAEFQAQVQAMINAAAALALAPLDFWDALQTMVTLPVIPARLLNLFRDRTEVRPASEPVHPTATRVAEAKHLTAINAAQDRAIVISKAAALPDLDLSDADNAAAVKDTLVQELEDLTSADAPAITDDTRQAIEDVRVAVIAVLGEAPALVGESPIVLEYTRPALVLASDLYGDFSRDLEIVQRNSVIGHPFFLPVSKPLRVLDE